MAVAEEEDTPVPPAPVAEKRGRGIPVHQVPEKGRRGMPVPPALAVEEEGRRGMSDSSWFASLPLANRGWTYIFLMGDVRGTN